MEEQPAFPRSTSTVVLWITVLAIFGLLLGLAEDLVRAIYHALIDPKFLRGFGIMLLQVLFASLLGGGIGVFVGSVILRSTWLSQATLRFLRLGQWLSFFVFWALPIWGFKEGQRTDAVFLTVVLLTVLIALLPTVTLAGCYHFLSARFTLGLSRREARPRVLRAIILHALLISLIWQILIHPYGWDWFSFPSTATTVQGYAGLILLVAFLLLLDLMFRSDFDHRAAEKGIILERELAGGTWKSPVGAVVLALAFLTLWLLFSTSLKKVFLVSPPKEVFEAGYRLLFSGTVPQGETVWGDIGFSLLEIFGGILLAGLAAFVVCQSLFVSVVIRNLALRLLPVTYIAPVILWLVVFVWMFRGGVRVFVWHSIVAVACLTFFPFVYVLWGLRECPFFCRALLAVDEALPYAFVAILLAEQYTATAGLGFFITVANATYQITEALTTSLITVFLLVVLSSTLRWVVKNLYFSESTPEVVPAQV
jgi:ABC-type nitrate/sulfonate/bicarbonate transport system permease component